MESKTYKRCEYIIRRFMSMDQPTPELTARFHEWLLNGLHCREKNLVISRLFYEALSDFNSDHEDPVSESEVLDKLPAMQTAD